MTSEFIKEMAKVSEKVAEGAESNQALKQMSKMLNDTQTCLAYTGEGEKLAAQYGVNEYSVGNFLATVLEGIKSGKIDINPLFK